MPIIDQSQNESSEPQYDRELIILQSASATIMSSLDLRHVLDAVTSEMVNLLGVEACTIFDWNQPDDKITVLGEHRPADWDEIIEFQPTTFKLSHFFITQRVLTERLATQLTSSTLSDIAQTHASYQPNIKTLLMIPMIFRERVVGLVDIIDRRNQRTFTPREVAMAKLLANHAAIAIENARLHTETEQQRQQLTLMQKLDRAITVSLRISDVYYAFASHVARMLNYDHMSIALLDKDALRVTYVNNKHAEMSALPVDMLLPYQASAAGWVTGHRQPLMRHNVAADSHFVEDEQLVRDRIKAHMIIPLSIKGKVIGTWNLGSREIGAYAPDDLALAQSVAAQLAVAIANAQSYGQAQQEIAERKRAEAALEEERTLLAHRVAEQTADLRTANAELARIARLKDEFLANVSHELRTPLTAILGLCEMLDMGVYGRLNEQQIKPIQNIDESGRHLLALINDILDVAKVEAKELELQIQPVSIEAVCQASLNLVKQMAHKKQLKISLSLDNTVSAIWADERRLKQILVNLLSNAVKFTLPGGSIGLEVSGDAKQKLVHFSVWDSGIGISKAHQKQLFQPFMQLDSKLSRQSSGTGLGLSLVYRLTQLHQGQVNLDSEPGRGSRFTISLPWSRSVFSDETTFSDTLLVDITEDIQVNIEDNASYSPLLLLAENDKKTALLLVDFLTRHGYRVIVAKNGLEALEKAKLEYPELVLMDIQMPEMDGLTAIGHMRANPELAAVPIIAVTARAMASDRERCLEAGASDYISKPISLAQLMQVLRTHLAVSSEVSNE